MFFPINPGAEEASWKRLFDEGIDRFLAGTFAGAYQQQLLAEFDTLPARAAAVAEVVRHADSVRHERRSLQAIDDY